MCFVDYRKLLIEFKKSCGLDNEKKIPWMMIKAVMSYCNEATKIKVRTSYSDEFPVKVDVHQG